MKKFYILLSAAVLFVSAASAQMVSLMIVDPTYPTTNDTVRVYLQCDFDYTPCEGFAQVDNITGTQIGATAMHCVGSLAALCSDFDTLVIPPLAAGQYTFSVLLLQGDMIVGCIIGPNPPGFGAVVFDVTQATSVAEITNNKNLVITPNPSNGNFSIKRMGNGASALKIFSADGRLMQTAALTDTETKMECRFQPGVYIVAEESHDKTVFSRLIIEK